jgi:hypothetical protein
MILEAIPATENTAEESEKTLTLVKVEQTDADATEMLPKWPCGGIMMSD